MSSRGKSLTVARRADGDPINSSLQDQTLGVVHWVLGSRSRLWMVDVDSRETRCLGLSGGMVR